MPRDLIKWAARHGRDLPWRHTRDPWAILVSEVMLQQTQVARVIPVWTAFLERFPTATACADARQADVVTAWHGGGVGILLGVLFVLAGLGRLLLARRRTVR